MLEKEKNIWIDVIDTYKDMPHLWDKSNCNYLNRDMRQQGFEILLKKYQVLDEGATLAIFKKKLENLRTTYNRELKKVKASRLSGTVWDDVYVPGLWYFDLFGFLDEHNQSGHESIYTLNDSDEESQSSTQQTSGDEKPFQQLSNNQTVMETTLVRPNKKRHRNLDQKLEELLVAPNKLMVMQEDDWEVIGKSIGIQLRDLNKYQQTIAQKLISDTIFYANMGRLCEESSISLRPASPTIQHPFVTQSRNQA